MTTPPTFTNRSPWLRFVGANIKGTPPMKAEAVAHDLRILLAVADVVGLVEFRHRWYWTTLRGLFARLKSARWRSFPRARRGILAPVWAGQALAWKRTVLRKRGTRTRWSHRGEKGISEDRRIRAVLLEELTSGLCCWFLILHNVVGGDRRGDGPKRKEMLTEEDLPALLDLLCDLRITGHPIVGQGDFNIADDSQAYGQLMDLFDATDATVHGEHGIEYLWTIPGRNGVEVEVKRDWIVPVDRLRTDHEGRGILFRLVQRPRSR